VGMNRHLRQHVAERVCVPHARGDEPHKWGKSLAEIYAFPTPVGMNRSATRTPRTRSGVPHARGDEPLAEHHRQCLLLRSPRPWG